jgi:hypothetical protein
MSCSYIGLEKGNVTYDKGMSEGKIDFLASHHFTVAFKEITLLKRYNTVFLIL